MSAPLSPVTLEVVRNGLYAIAEEMSVIVMRSARSPLLKEAGDLSSALTDAQGRLIAQGRDIPIHMGVMGFTVKEFLKRIPVERLRDGDVWFLNLPEVGGNHLPDVKAVRPVFFEGRLVAFAVNLAHWADIGGAVPGSYVTVGDRVLPGRPPHRARYGSSPRTDPSARPSTSCCRTCAAATSAKGTSSPSSRPTTWRRRRLARAVRPLRRGDGGGLLRAPARRVRGADARGPAGPARRRLGGRGLPRRRRHRGPAHPHQGARGQARRRGDLRLRGHRPAGPRPRQHHVLHRLLRGVLRHEGAGRSGRAAQRGLLPAARGDRAARAACSTPIRIARWSAAITRPRSAWWTPSCKALAPVIARSRAGGGPDHRGAPHLRRAHGRTDAGPSTTRCTGAGRARPRPRTAPSAIRVHMSNVMNTPVEVVESEYPLVVEEQALRPGSGGRRRAPRRPRLPPRVSRARAGRDAHHHDRAARRAALRLCGGKTAAPFRITLNPGTPRERDVTGKETMTLADGDLVVLETCGRRRLRRPADRPPALADADRREGYVS